MRTLNIAHKIKRYLKNVKRGVVNITVNNSSIILNLPICNDILMRMLGVAHVSPATINTLKTCYYQNIEKCDRSWLRLTRERFDKPCQYFFQIFPRIVHLIIGNSAADLKKKH